ncbi:hypothetical protein HYV57_03395 [Candidatus Peregrinibacteria bacterium]|nr:hypothetical protein [Candidatus Peregrinibacteria bacterium]
MTGFYYDKFSLNNQVIQVLTIFFNKGSYAFSFEKKYMCWKAGARRSDTRLDQKGRKFAKNAIGYAFFNAHFRLFLKTSLPKPPPSSICFQRNLRMILNKKFAILSLKWHFSKAHRGIF